MSRLMLIHLVFAGYLAALAFGKQEVSLFKHDEYYTVVDSEAGETTVYAVNVKETFTNSFSLHIVFNETTTPGLRHFRKTPELGIAKIDQSVQHAKNIIPKDKRRSTYIMFLVTGLDHLSGNESTVLLEAVQTYIPKSGFRWDNGSLSQLMGRNALYMWETVNVLLGNFKKRKSKTVAVLDMGESDVGEAYVPSDLSKLKPQRLKHIKNVTLFGKPFGVYTYGITGLGLYEGRVQILSQGRDMYTDIYTSVCIHPKIVGTWWFEGHMHTYKGSQQYGNQTVNVTACMNAVKTVLAMYSKGQSLAGEEDVYATSLFYHVASAVGLVKYGKNVTVTMAQLRKQTKIACGWKDPKHPFVCMDAMFSIGVLNRMFGLWRESVVSFVYKLRGEILNWALGAAFDKYEQQVNAKANATTEISRKRRSQRNR